ncbi:MAG: endonuclease/exonuclease/phosphatase family protein [Hymenobacteraceae bacterium]|nr:endonuclease/exonuclease/phosphatase family protein [Hymenobacteraceae bacterium]
MKIVTWNCNGALRNKFEHLSTFEADIYIIQECEDPERSRHPAYMAWAKNHIWNGDTKNKGLGIFAAEHIKIEPLDWSNTYQDHTVKYILPCQINDMFQLLGIWTHQNNSPNFGYIGQLWKYLQVNKQHLKQTLIAGDFNSNAIWDQWDRWWNHSDVVKELEELGIRSLYHLHNKEEQGKESIPTFFFHRKPERPYHIDYVFGSQEFYTGLTKFEIGDTEQWLKISDHLPISCEFELI